MDLFQYISKWHEISLAYILLYDIYDPKVANSKMFKQRTYDQSMDQIVGVCDVLGPMQITLTLFQTLTNFTLEEFDK